MSVCIRALEKFVFSWEIVCFMSYKPSGGKLVSRKAAYTLERFPSPKRSFPPVKSLLMETGLEKRDF
jgi:hypothetical protein